MSTDVHSTIHDAVSFLIIMVRRKLRKQEDQDCMKPDVIVEIGLSQRILWTNTTLEERGGEGFIFHEGAYQEIEAITIILLFNGFRSGCTGSFHYTLW